MNYHDANEFWSLVIADALASGHLRVPKMNFRGIPTPRPESSGLFRRSVGEPKGQIADWRANIPNSSRGVHVVEYPGHYAVHVDHYDPAKHPILHLVRDSPLTLATMLAVGLGSLLLMGIFGKQS